MSYTFWTTTSIAILVLGAPAIFIWFLTDIKDLLADIRAPHDSVQDLVEIPALEDAEVKGEAPHETNVALG